MAANVSNRRLAVVDAGNSRLKLAVCEEGVHLPCAGASWAQGRGTLPDLPMVLEVEHGADPRGPVGMLRDACQELDATALVLVSVVPEITAQIVEALPQAVVIDHDLEVPFGWGVRDPARVGPDRLVNMAMVRAWGLDDALVVDAGTATTFDLMDGGVFRGGMIAPGMAFSAAKLGEYAARLEPVPFGPCPVAVGDDTAAAMAAGAWHTGIRGVDGTINALLEAYGPRPVILTGGLGHYLLAEDRTADPFWTLRGAAWLYLSQHHR